MTTNIEIHALGPLLFRDARPFGATGDEARAGSLPVPYPGTVAGFIRTSVGNRLGWTWSSHDARRAREQIQLRGFLLKREITDKSGSSERHWVLPAPRNAVPFNVDGDKAKVGFMRLNPQVMESGEGCDLPVGGLLPVSITQDVKPASGYRLWTFEQVDRWLQGTERAEEEASRDIGAPGHEERVQVAVDSVRQAALDGQLFTVDYRLMESRLRNQTLASWTFGAQAELGDVTLDVGKGLNLAGPLGGEQRPVIARFTSAGSAKDADWPEPSPELRQALLGAESGKRVVMMLATPAIYSAGWRPGWTELSGIGEGQSVRVRTNLIGPLSALGGARLVSAVVGRAEPVSGWNYEAGQQGPKATRRTSPGGSMYFFELSQPLTAEQLRALWLQPTSDEQQDRNDGYGTAVWGVWK